MYAEVYKWFTETSGQGLMEQTALMMNPKPAAKEEEIAEAIEMWEEKVNRLARHGDDYRLSEALKKVALKNILVGKIKDNFELWESDRMPFEEILRRVKDQARAKKLDKYAQRGRSGISLGVSQDNGHRPGQEYETWEAPAGAQNSGEDGPQELNSAQDGKGKGGKAKGKGTYGKGKGKWGWKERGRKERQ